MLPIQPATSRYLHDAHAITRSQLDALEEAGALTVRGAHDAASARLARTPASSHADRTTPLDVGALTASRARAIAALARTSHAHTIPHLEAISLTPSAAEPADTTAPREVSAWAEAAFVRRTTRLVRLIELDAPESVVASELEQLHETIRRLDSLRPTAEVDEDLRFFPDSEIARFSDPRFDLSLGSFTAIIDEVADFHRAQKPADGSEVLAFGRPLLAIDFASPPPELFERAVLERGVYDEVEERAHAYAAPWGPWLEWSVVEDGAASVESIRDTLRWIRADLLAAPPELRAELASSIECDFAPFVTCDDWIAELDARLVLFEHDVVRALEEDLVLLSRVVRDPSY